MKHFITIIFLFILLSSHAQQVVLEVDTILVNTESKFGKNLTHYTHTYISAHQYIFSNDDVCYNSLLGSHDFNFGLRYKRKLNNTFSFGGDLALSVNNFRIDQTIKATSQILDTTTYDKEKYKFKSFSPSLYFRINYGKRGNQIGVYTDIGAYFDVILRGNYIVKYTDDKNQKIKSITRNLYYLEPANYGFLFRLGYNRLALSAKYRFSDMFSDKRIYPEPVRLKIGLELGLF